MPSLTARPWWRRWFGNRSERAAATFLRGLGYRIVEHNFTCALGEIDIVALDGSCLVFVEVRSTEADDPSGPALSVDRRKQAKLTRLAQFYLKSKQLTDCAARFDVLAICWPAAQTEPRIVHYPSAFEASG